MGKTTIAAALVNDEEIRSSFEKIVWVSVGQEPDIRELQDSMHHQLSKQHFQDNISTNADAFTAVRDVAKGVKTLLVLDEVTSVVNSLGGKTMEAAQRDPFQSKF